MSLRRHFPKNKDAAKYNRFLGWWALSSMPDPVQQYCRRTAYNNVLDWYTALSFRAKADDYAKLLCQCYW